MGITLLDRFKIARLWLTGFDVGEVDGLRLPQAVVAYRSISLGRPA